jgi:hypothetical protein
LVRGGGKDDLRRAGMGNRYLVEDLSELLPALLVVLGSAIRGFPPIC